jgi:hypothetical protein
MSEKAETHLTVRSRLSALVRVRVADIYFGAVLCRYGAAPFSASLGA